MKLQVVLMGGQIIEQDDGAPPAGEEVLEGQHLTAIAQRALCEQPHLRQAVEYHPRGVELAHAVENKLGGFAQLQLGRMQDGEFLVRVKSGFRRYEFEHLNLVQGPA